MKGVTLDAIQKFQKSVVDSDAGGSLKHNLLLAAIFRCEEEACSDGLSEDASQVQLTVKDRDSERSRQIVVDRDTCRV